MPECYKMMDAAKFVDCHFLMPSNCEAQVYWLCMPVHSFLSLNSSMVRRDSWFQHGRNNVEGESDGALWRCRCRQRWLHQHDPKRRLVTWSGRGDISLYMGWDHVQGTRVLHVNPIGTYCISFYKPIIWMWTQSRGGYWVRLALLLPD